jgi:hypothetical protein
MRAIALLALSALALSEQPPLRPTPQTPARDVPARPSRSNPPQVADASTGAIRGRVLVDGAQPPTPIVKARVAIAGGATANEPIFTDSDGRFEFGGLATGHYVLSAEKTGFAPTRYGARGPFDPVEAVDLTAGASENVEIRMPKAAAIFGRVLDELGDPVVGAVVSVSAIHRDGASRRLENVVRFPTDTDDLGNYRVGGLPAGQYLLSIAARAYSTLFADLSNLAIAPGGANPGRRIGAGRTFYPGGTSAGAATPIDLGAGEERGGTDITVVPFRPAELSVTLSTTIPDPPRPSSPAEAARMGFDMRALQAMNTAMLTFLPSDEPDLAMPFNQRIGFPTAGPGPWAIPALAIDPGDWIAIAGRGNTSALARFSVTGGDLATLSLPLTAGAGFSGRIAFEGPTAHPRPSAVQIDVIGAGPDVNISPRLLAPGGPFTPRPDGTFDMTGVVGTVEIVVVDPPGWAARNLMTGDRDILGTPITLHGSETFAGLQLLLTDRVAEFSGSLVGADSEPAPGCAVAVFPSAPDAAPGQRRMRLARANKQGQFRFENLPAGSYLAAARQDIDVSTWTARDSIERLRAGATPITIVDRQQLTATLQCASAR